MDIISLIKNRKSIRAYTDKQVSKETIDKILDAARWTPSAVNAQPWEVAVVTNKIKDKFSEKTIDAKRNKVTPNPDYNFYQIKDWPEPYATRRKKCGLALLNSLKVHVDDHERRNIEWEKNYTFFDAPVGIFFFVDKCLDKGVWMDCGMFMQNVMLAATEYGLNTCIQAATAQYPDIVRDILGIPNSKILIAGLALGYADLSHPVNNYRTERESVDKFAKFFGF